MPNWEPNWNDVKWDEGAAIDAARALFRAADKLDEIIERRVREAAGAQKEWRGRHSEQFDDYLNEMGLRSRRISQEYRETARKIIHRTQLAMQDQRNREKERERWKQQKAEEERR